jgi:hypothetical protein
VFERAKTVHALSLAATVIGAPLNIFIKKNIEVTTPDMQYLQI